MQITIDTPYTTVRELSRRSGQSERAIRNEIERGRILIREKSEGSKEAVLVNMLALAIEAADQAERVLAKPSASKR
ncbi:hypothetical protein PflCFBP13517_16835 [Pseudomonas fluorescens]|uniref:hypothetical protein n=1 Tax=Pseudomonas sp. CFT9 TaxID=911244 RepID=UPI000357C807|nr:hypothetical protein [Pseudomonas sp. CFT9]EPJ86466.1 hypothetical protein CFT9_07646 [Pseudomonas sp. CFT9]MBU0801827.1 hypothetical protein [Alphaproteobacteria bacterium]OKP69408.1 hypothetical protein BTR19_17875 [Pseudomonas fluorescens]TKK40171.1 hypothetical protein PflCFBP13517_16835 [Pseudomonas fluorescens]